MLGLIKKTAAFHSVRQISLIALPPLRFPAVNILVCAVESFAFAVNFLICVVNILVCAVSYLLLL